MYSPNSISFIPQDEILAYYILWDPMLKVKVQFERQDGLLTQFTLLLCVCARLRASHVVFCHADWWLGDRDELSEGGAAEVDKTTWRISEGEVMREGDGGPVGESDRASGGRTDHWENEEECDARERQRGGGEWRGERPQEITEGQYVLAAFYFHLLPYIFFYFCNVHVFQLTPSAAHSV